MNIQNIDRLIEIIRNEENHFNMYNWYWTSYGIDKFAEEDEFPDCGSPACMCGWANAMEYTEKGLSYKNNDLFDEKNAADWLGINNGVEDYTFIHLFEPQLDSEYWGLITREECIQTLEHLKATGEISWDHVRNSENYQKFLEENY